MATTPEAYVHLSTDETTLTFYYDTLRADRNGETWGIREIREIRDRRRISLLSSLPAWAGYRHSPSTTVFTAVFDASFHDFCPTTTAGWFYEFKSLKSIEGLEHLNTSQLTDMGCMFYGCASLTYLFVHRRVRRISACLASGLCAAAPAGGAELPRGAASTWTSCGASSCSLRAGGGACPR